jgi:hypothetical protein
MISTYTDYRQQFTTDWPDKLFADLAPGGPDPAPQPRPRRFPAGQRFFALTGARGSLEEKMKNS